MMHAFYLPHQSLFKSSNLNVDLTITGPIVTILNETPFSTIYCYSFLSLGIGMGAVMSDTICWLGWCLAWCLAWDSGVGWLPLPQIGKQAGPSSLNTSTAELKHLTDLEW